jgi:hypothetical protein
LYNALAQKAKQMAGGKLSSTSTIACAGLAGGAAGMIGNPTEVRNFERYFGTKAKGLRSCSSGCVRME